jgi:hypothetical protein
MILAVVTPYTVPVGLMDALQVTLLILVAADPGGRGRWMGLLRHCPRDSMSWISRPGAG